MREGQRFQVRTPGAIEAVEALIWVQPPSDATDPQLARPRAVQAEIYAGCAGGGRALLRTVAVPADRFPNFAGIHGVYRTTVFLLDPPIAVQVGDVVDVVFRSLEGGAASGIFTRDVDPASEALSLTDGCTRLVSGWDHAAWLRLHP